MFYSKKLIVMTVVKKVLVGPSILLIMFKEIEELVL